MHLNKFIKKRNYFIIYFILSSLLVIYMLDKRDKYELNEAKFYLNESKLILDSTIDNYSDISKIVYTQIVQKEQLKDILLDLEINNQKSIEIARKRLYNLFKPIYKNLSNSNFTQLHFHSSDGKSLLRFYQPDRFDDYLYNSRESVQMVHENKKFVKCFEVSKLKDSFRYIYPITLDNNFLGSVELSISFEIVQKNIAKFINANSTILLNRDIIYKKVFKKELENFNKTKFSNDYIYSYDFLNRRGLVSESNIKKINFKLRHNIEFQKSLELKNSFSKIVKVDNKKYIVNFLRVDNLIKKPVGFLVTYIEYKSQYSIYRAIFEVLIINLFMIVALFLLYKIKKNSKYLQNYKEAIKKGRIKLKEKKMELIYKEDYTQALLNSSDKILFSIKDNQLIYANNNFFHFFKNFNYQNNSIKWSSLFKMKHVNQRGYLFNIESDRDWINKLLDNPGKKYKISIEKSSQEFIFRVRLEYYISSLNRSKNNIIFMDDITLLEKQKVIINTLNNQDSYSNLLTKKRFLSILDNFISDNDSKFSRYIIRISVNKYDNLLKKYGYTICSKLMNKISSIIKSKLYENVIITHWSDDTFLIIIKSDEVILQNKLKSIQTTVRTMEFKKIWNISCSYNYIEIFKETNRNILIDNIVKKSTFIKV